MVAAFSFEYGGVFPVVVAIYLMLFGLVCGGLGLMLFVVGGRCLFAGLNISGFWLLLVVCLWCCV